MRVVSQHCRGKAVPVGCVYVRTMVGESTDHLELSMICSQHQGRHSCLIASVHIGAASQKLNQLSNLTGLSDFP